MRINELLTELGLTKRNFRGYPCKTNCSGHGAGALWAGKKNIKNPAQCPKGSSPSFQQGCQIQAGQDELDNEV